MAGAHAVEFTVVVLESQLCLCSVTLGQLFNFSELLFLHLFKGLINNTCKLGGVHGYNCEHSLLFITILLLQFTCNECHM